MQKLDLYLMGDGFSPKAVNAAGNSTSDAVPRAVKGCQYGLYLHFVTDTNDPLEVPSCATWEWVMASDYDPATTPELRVTSGIVRSASQSGSSAVNDTLYIPVNANTTQLISWLGTTGSEEYKTGHCEIAGFDASGNRIYGAKHDLIVYRTRLSSGLTPSEVGDGSTVVTHEELDEELEDLTIAWTAVTNKPESFTPADHDHDMADVTGLDSALAGKAASDHTHSGYESRLTALETAVDGVADILEEL